MDRFDVCRCARQTMEMRGDLLNWFGELEPGTYELAAGYEHGALRAVSTPVPLRVLPARAVSVSGALGICPGLSHHCLIGTVSHEVLDH